MKRMKPKSCDEPQQIRNPRTNPRSSLQELSERRMELVRNAHMRAEHQAGLYEFPGFRVSALGGQGMYWEPLALEGLLGNCVSELYDADL